jgi:hypothetical protein
MNEELKTGLYGIVAEFDDPTDITIAAQRVKDAGFTRFEAYSPYPIEELSEIVVKRNTGLPWLVFLGGAIGFLTGLGLQYYTHVIDYPINVGGRPLASWPSFIPVTFELTILCASLTAVFGMIALNGLPQPYHPVFNIPRFDLASRNRFFLVIEAGDPKFDRDEATRLLRGLNSREVSDVEY